MFPPTSLFWRELEVELRKSEGVMITDVQMIPEHLRVVLIEASGYTNVEVGKEIGDMGQDTVASLGVQELSRLPGTDSS